MRRLVPLLFLSLLVAGPASAELWFEPVAPTTDDAVFLHVAQPWHDSCLPQNPVVTRSGNRVEALWSEPVGVGCLQAVMPWRDRAPLGMFEAGVYEVVPRVRLRDGRVLTLPSQTLIVREGRLPFAITPAYASIRGGEVVFEGREFCADVSTRVTVRIDGIEVPSRRAFCAVTATVPAHAVGAADVTIVVDGQSRTYRASLRYIDPHAAPDPAVVEKILVPLLFSGPGAFGSQWVTEASVTNRDEGDGQRFEWYPFRPCSTSLCGTGVNWLQTASLMTMFGNRPNGLLLFVERQQIADGLYFGSIIRDVSREESWGTEVPIVREKDFRTGYTLLPNVPFDPKHRATLRVYGVDGALDRAWIDVQAPGRAPVSQIIDLPRQCAQPPCNTDQPAFVAIDLNAMFARLVDASAGPVNVAVRPNDGWNVQRYWAFVSVTHNETQNVTVITPQN